MTMLKARVALSTRGKVFSGLLQGSVLRTVLFNIVVNNDSGKTRKKNERKKKKITTMKARLLNNRQMLNENWRDKPMLSDRTKSKRGTCYREKR